MSKLFSVVKLVLIMMLATILEVVLYAPFEYLEGYIVGTNIIGVGTSFNIIYEIAVNIIIIAILMMIFKVDKLGLREKIDNSSFIVLFTCLLIFGYHNIYSNTIGLAVNMIDISPWLTESFNELIEYPIYALLSLCVFAPIFEEIVFRGIVLKVLMRRHSDWFAAIFSSLLFASVHFNIHQGINAMVVGLILAFIYIKTGSLRLCIFAHFFNNFYVIFEGYFDAEIEGFIWYRLLLGVIVLIIGFGGYYIKEINKSLIQIKANE